jgi:hypothetical protein
MGTAFGQKQHQWTRMGYLPGTGAFHSLQDTPHSDRLTGANPNHAPLTSSSTQTPTTLQTWEIHPTPLTNQPVQEARPSANRAELFNSQEILQPLGRTNTDRGSHFEHAGMEILATDRPMPMIAQSASPRLLSIRRNRSVYLPSTDRYRPHLSVSSTPQKDPPTNHLHRRYFITT